MIGLLRPLRDLVWPASCIACATAGQSLCVRCAVEVAACGDPRWHSPDPCPTSFPPTVSWGDYEGALARLVVAHKDEDRTDAAHLLAVPLAEVIGIALEGLSRPLLVPVPSSSRSRRRRGRDPLLDIVRRVRLPQPVPVLPMLVQSRRVADQARLDHRERRENLHAAMALRPGWGPVLDGADIILVDDVVTTGATLAEATRAVLEDRFGGERADSVCAVAICATARREQEGSDRTGDDV